ncbi:multiple coagulation factor deficiency protein 2 homolog isoform X2 [Phymastichus coffea]|uniref:multiple coagulation factor deficiency protein 2 homolog isoform X2 n=1 Tax=Phymastichus coffea TaxID=108790 RepID=UPI00273A8072|nr:multiple coagulation factor deficiency protein 2 homolog isoform X2 [Phymastichus coffea]
MNWIFIFFMILHCKCNGLASQDRVPPGVPPQHYQQPSLPNHHGSNFQHSPQYQMPQYQAPQQQQILPNQQQMPITSQAQYIPDMSNVHQPINQQIPEVHNHGHHMQSQHILNTANIAEEKAHIAEHLDIPMDTNKMSEQELQFHYFKMHDADNNNKLDGCELIKSLIHWHEGNKEGTNKEKKIFKDEELSALIDPILAMDDTNNDGFIDYPEFIQAQQKAASTTAGQ